MANSAREEKQNKRCMGLGGGGSWMVGDSMVAGWWLPGGRKQCAQCIKRKNEPK